jgi:hypothetical protein
LEIFAVDNLKDKYEKYRDIRKLVWNEATYATNSKQHDDNKSCLKNNICKLCKASDLSKFEGNSDNTKKLVWHHLWTKIRYAGIKADIASKEIEDISSIFDNYEEFSMQEWDIKIEWNEKSKKHTLIQGGDCINSFLNRNGIFYGKQTVGNLVKLNKTVSLARAYAAHIRNKKPLDFVTSGLGVDRIWPIHNHLQEIGYTSNLTALHFMMDLGFQVIKPDIVISRLFLTLGWLHDIIPNLPQDLTVDDLVGKGKYKSKYQYTKPIVYMPVIDLARKIIGCTRESDLQGDIGWSTNNPIREFDIFMVKFGQEPEKHWGLTKNLAKETGNNISKISKCPSSVGGNVS